MVSVRARIQVPLESGDSTEFVTFDGLAGDPDHFAVVFHPQRVAAQPAPWVRVHSECITGDLFGSLRCDCGSQLDEARWLFCEEGGILLYLRQEGRGIGLKRKLDAYLLQDQGLDTFQANLELSLPRDAREFSCAAQMLRALGHDRIRLLTNNQRKERELAAHGITVAEIRRTRQYITAHNARYLQAKQEQDGHVFLAA